MCTTFYTGPSHVLVFGIKHSQPLRLRDHAFQEDVLLLSISFRPPTCLVCSANARYSLVNGGQQSSVTTRAISFSTSFSSKTPPMVPRACLGLVVLPPPPHRFYMKSEALASISRSDRQPAALPGQCVTRDPGTQPCIGHTGHSTRCPMSREIREHPCRLLSL